MPTQAELDNLFTHHSPTPEQVERYRRLRKAAKEFAKVVVLETPASADQSAALRKIREAVMTANAAIACYRPELVEKGPGTFTKEELAALREMVGPQQPITRPRPDKLGEETVRQQSDAD